MMAYDGWDPPNDEPEGAEEIVECFACGEDPLVLDQCVFCEALLCPHCFPAHVEGCEAPGPEET